MVAILERQKFNDGIPAGLPEGTPVAHKRARPRRSITTRRSSTDGDRSCSSSSYPASRIRKTAPRSRRDIERGLDSLEIAPTPVPSCQTTAQPARPNFRHELGESLAGASDELLDSSGR
jgi:hypothetical protein